MRIHRIKRNLRLKLQLSAALLVAGLFSLRQPREAWPRIRGAFKTWLRWRQDETPAPFWIFYGRIRHCQKCPLYYAPLATCGSPLAKNLRGLGCWCHLLTKAHIIHADCYLRENGIHDAGGWPDNLRWLSGSAEGERQPQPKPCGGCGKTSSPP